MIRAVPHTDRRAVIAKALYACVTKQGYANTSLTDIAGEAKMSPSHISYYFENKRAILEHYSLGLCEQILDGLPDLSEPDSERLSDTLANFCFGEGQLNTALLSMIQEISGLAAHDSRIRRIKTYHATAWRKYLEAFFAQVGTAPGMRPGDAARLAHAVLVGLNTNTLFDRGMNRRTAHRLFRQTLRDLAGLRENFHTPARRTAPPRRIS